MSELSKKHLALLEARSIDVELVSRLAWSTETSMGSEWLVIPFLKGGVVVNHKYRTLSGEKKFRQDPNATKCFWNEDVLRDKTLEGVPLIITEGELDAVACIQAGFPRTMSVPDGAPAKPIGGADDSAKYSYVRDALHLIDATEVVILWTDADMPGLALREDLALQLGPHRCKIIDAPINPETGRPYKDANELLHELGEAELARVVHSAKWCSRDGVYSMDELPDQAPKYRYDLGMGPSMDKLASIRLGDFWVVTGVPGHGKSTFVDDVVCRAAKRHGLKTAFASFEKEPKPEHQRLLRKWFIANERGHSGEEKWRAEEVRAADEFIRRSFAFISPALNDTASLEWLMQRMATAVTQDEVNIIVVDPWNEIEHDRPRDVSLTEYVGASIKRLKRFALMFNVLVIVVAHPAKMSSKDELTLYSVSDSAHWANKCDVGWIVSRDKDDVAKLQAAKVRYATIGSRGEVSAYLDRVAMKFFVAGDSAASHRVGRAAAEEVRVAEDWDIPY